MLLDGIRKYKSQKQEVAMATRKIFSMKEVQSAVDEVKESTLNSVTSKKAKMHVIQMAGNIIRNLNETYGHRKMSV
jgi:hypothetical protein